MNHICHICCGDAPLFVANDIVQSLGNSPVAVVVPAGPRVCTNLWCKDGVDAAVCNDVSRALYFPTTSFGGGDEADSFFDLQNNYEVNYERGVLANYMQDVIDSCSFNTNIGPSGKWNFVGYLDISLSPQEYLANSLRYSQRTSLLQRQHQCSDQGRSWGPMQSKLRVLLRRVRAVCHLSL